MKIKISIFVSLLPFTLSVFPSPYIAPFHSIVNVTQSPFLLPQIPSPLFMITTEHGLYMWRISMIVSIYNNDTQIFILKRRFFLANNFKINCCKKK